MQNKYAAPVKSGLQGSFSRMRICHTISNSHLKKLINLTLEPYLDHWYCMLCNRSYVSDVSGQVKNFLFQIVFVSVFKNPGRLHGGVVVEVDEADVVIYNEMEVE